MRRDSPEYRQKQFLWAKHCQKRKDQLTQKATIPEVIVLNALKTMGIKFHFQKGTFCKWTGIRIMDFYLSKPFRLAIEIDGKGHNKIQDEKRENQIRIAYRRIRFLRISNEEVLTNRLNIIDLLRAKINDLQILSSKTVRI